MRKITVALLRVSTDMQELNSQKTAIQEYCRANKIVIGKWIEEYDVSGYSTPLHDRKGLMQIKDMAINNELERLVVFNLDRIGRDMEFNSYITMLDNLNVEILSVTEGKISNADINDKLITNIKFWLAESESIKIGLRSKAGLLAANKQGRYAGGIVNYGYRLNKETRQLEINPDEAMIVRKIFKMYLTMGVINIVKALKEEGIKKRSVKNKEIDFNESGIGKLLSNRIYIGYKQYGGSVKTSKDKTNKNRTIDKSKIQYQEYNPNLQIIDNELFEKVQELKKHRCNIKDVSNRCTIKTKELLSGLVYHKCGDGKLRKIYVSSRYEDKEKTKFYTLYKCKHCSAIAYKNFRKNYKSSTINEFVEGYILKAMDRLNEDKLKENILKIENKAFEDIETDIKNLKIELEKQERILTNANKELEMYFLGESLLTADVISSMIKKSESKIDEINNKIKESTIKLTTKKNNNSNITNIINKYKNFNAIYNSANIYKRKAMMEEIIDKVILDGDDIEIVLKLGIFYNNISYQ